MFLIDTRGDAYSTLIREKHLPSVENFHKCLLCMLFPSTSTYPSPLATQPKQVTVNESHTPNIGFQKNNAINTPFPLQSTFKTLLRKGQIKWFIKKFNYTDVSKIYAMCGVYLHILNTVPLVLSSSQISLGKMMRIHAT